MRGELLARAADTSPMGKEPLRPPCHMDEILDQKHADHSLGAAPAHAAPPHWAKDVLMTSPVAVTPVTPEPMHASCTPPTSEEERGDEAPAEVMEVNDLGDDDLELMLSESTLHTPSPHKKPSSHRRRRTPPAAQRPFTRAKSLNDMSLERVFSLVEMLERTVADAQYLRQMPMSHDPWMPYEPFDGSMDCGSPAQRMQETSPARAQNLAAPGPALLHGLGTIEERLAERGSPSGYFSD